MVMQVIIVWMEMRETTLSMAKRAQINSTAVKVTTRWTVEMETINFMEAMAMIH